MSDQPLRPRIAAIARIAIPVVILAALAFGVWRLANDTDGVRRQVAPPPMVALVAPPPPPPPPPPKEQPPEPEKETEPTPSPDPKPEAPQKSDAPKQLTINGPAQSGSDAFGVAAGKGGGLSVGGDPNGSDTPGGGFAEANYQRYLRAQLQTAIQADDRVNRLFFNAQVRIWVRPDGAIGVVDIAKSSGDDRADRALVAALQALPRLDPPPPQLKFPARVALRGRRA
jgi:TonB family protein